MKDREDIERESVRERETAKTWLGLKWDTRTADVQKLERIKLNCQTVQTVHYAFICYFPTHIFRRTPYRVQRFCWRGILFLNHFITFNIYTNEKDIWGKKNPEKNPSSNVWIDACIKPRTWLKIQFRGWKKVGSGSVFIKKKSDSRIHIYN